MLILLQRGVVLAFDQGLDEEREPVCNRIPRSVQCGRASVCATQLMCCVRRNFYARASTAGSRSTAPS